MLGDTLVIRLKATGQELWRCAAGVVPMKGEFLYWTRPDGQVTTYVVDNIQHFFATDPAGLLVYAMTVVEVKLPP